MTTTSDIQPPVTPRFEAPPPYPSQKDFAALVGRAEEGDDDALAELQSLLDHYDALWDPLEMICRLVERHLVGVAAGDSRTRHCQFARFVLNVRRDFLDGDGDPLEAFLIHRIVVSYLIVAICKNRAAEVVSADNLCYREQIWESAKQRVHKFLAPFREYEEVREFGGSGGIPNDFENCRVP